MKWFKLTLFFLSYNLWANGSESQVERVSQKALSALMAIPQSEGTTKETGERALLPMALKQVEQIIDEKVGKEGAEAVKMAESFIEGKNSSNSLSAIGGFLKKKVQNNFKKDKHKSEDQDTPTQDDDQENDTDSDNEEEFLLKNNKNSKPITKKRRFKI